MVRFASKIQKQIFIAGMALVLEILKSSIEIETVEKWLLGELTATVEVPLFSIADRVLFPAHLNDFIKQATSRYVKKVSINVPKTAQVKKKSQKPHQPGKSHSFQPHSNDKGALSLHETNKFSPSHRSPSFHQRSKSAHHTGNKPAHSEFQLKDFMPSDSAFSKPRKKASLVPVVDPPPDLLNDTEFPPIGASRKKRINPTPLLNVPAFQNNTKDFSTAAKSVPISTPFREAQERDSQHNLEDERALLRQARGKPPPQLLVSLFPVVSLTSEEPVASVESFSCPTFIKPSLQLVSETSTLDRLALLWATCLKNNLVTHWYSELQYLIELLTTVDCDPSPAQETLFSSIHQVSYFAAGTLRQLADDLTQLDSATVRFLAENSQVVEFAPQLVDKLVRHLAVSQENDAADKKQSQSLQAPASVHTHVAFQSDTDNRSNFPSEDGFRAFRKQRDTFYAVWREWEDNHSNPEWSLSETQGRRITYLLNLCPDPINLFHLARLFQAQLIATCGSCTAMTTASPMQSASKVPVNEDDPFLLSLKESNPAKFRRLQERLINPSHAGDTNIFGVAFPGHQDFFRQFLLVTNHVVFVEQLKNLLASTIQDWDEQAGAHEWTETDDYVSNNSARHRAFTTRLLLLRLLAKFLGFITFLPYQIRNTVPENVVQTQLALRKHVHAPLDVGHKIEKAIENQQLLITLPWVVMFLAMADAVSVRLPLYQALFAALESCYRHRLKAPYLPANNAFFLKLVVSWLFEQPYVALSKGGKATWLSSNCNAGSLQASPSSVDQRWLIDSAVLYQCCPYLYFIKALLKDGRGTAAGSSKAVAGSMGRKITPVAAQDSGNGTHLLPSIQTRLEENFFYGQPSIVKRTVDMLAERLAANIIKQTRMQIIPNLLQATASNLTEEDGTQSCVKLCEVVGKEMESLISSYGSAREAALSVLLPYDTSPAVLAACQPITHRLCRDKCHQWFKSEITPGWFEAELNACRAKLGKDSKTTNFTADEGAPSETRSADNATSPTLLLIRLRDCVGGIIQGETIPSEKEVLDLVADVTPALCQRVLLLPLVEKQIFNLTFELLTTLICFLPDLASNELADQLVELWVTNLPKESSSSSNSAPSPFVVFSPRQMLLLSQSPEPRLTWSRWTRLVTSLVKAQLLTPAELETQCLGVIRQEWPSALLRRLAACLQDFVDWQNASRATGAQSTDESECVQLIDWLAWFFMEVDNA